MKKIRFNGLRPKGTLRPRRMWTPGEVLEVEDEVAGELLWETDFTQIEEKRRSKKAEG
jgi:hypothetical protein